MNEKIAKQAEFTHVAATQTGSQSSYIHPIDTLCAAPSPFPSTFPITPRKSRHHVSYRLRGKSPESCSAYGDRIPRYTANRRSHRSIPAHLHKSVSLLSHTHTYVTDNFILDGGGHTGSPTLSSLVHSSSPRGARRPRPIRSLGGQWIITRYVSDKYSLHRLTNPLTTSGHRTESWIRYYFTLHSPSRDWRVHPFRSHSLPLRRASTTAELFPCDTGSMHPCDGWLSGSSLMVLRYH